MVAPNTALENVFGTLGAVCWSIQLVPQIWKSWRKKDTAGLSTGMMLIWFVSGIWLGAYCYTSGLSVPLVVQPQAFCLFSAIAWAQCLVYDSKWKTWQAVSIATFVCALASGIEAALIFGTKALQDRGNNKMNQALGIIAAVFIIAGLLPQYWEVYKYRAVIGISLIFLLVDLLGGVFSFLSLVWTPPPFDTLACVSYSGVVGLEIGIFVLAAVLNPGYWRRKREEEKRRKLEEGTATLSPPDGEATEKAKMEQRTDTGATLSSASAEEGAAGEKVVRTMSEVERIQREAGFGWLGEQEHLPHPHLHHHQHEAVDGRG
ncbi:Cystinosin/ERS1p repeat protein [Rhodotorula toruloides]|uniref:BY PROTMAP: gi/472580656/gb/EMS18440.1/ Cystinosin/ERS1p repeat protein [Rhodosporidium toruloides NP11] gi/647397143/emb/CDR39944.1/ RHTO0S04e12354g1_1 [Rhodosporidium toruloides] n=1 Tax=Rhodotorula toruloides TaxID=5286 RepID=A0A0K3CK38_RHOTO|nr:Cystinosin/ERS1p repeat protein [Rhodotorula toruloides]PRQ73501.1 PQ loop repeat-domain containing protein [Rhodotorula toruloides]